MTVCFNLMKPGARMVHVTDLGGYGFFDDPMPPLDFQVYPDWLYSLMCPKYGRATRRPIGEYVASARAAGFQKVEVRIIEFVLSAAKPADVG
jgi:hypothetical protein